MAGLSLAVFFGWGVATALAQMSESFEYGVPPPGWTKTNLLGGGGWYQLSIGTMPLPGWGNGTSSVPGVANSGTHNAYCSWTTGGGAGDGYHNDQWLISPRLTGLTATSTVSYWLRFAFTNFPDTVYFRVSTNGPAPANFTMVPLTNIFARASWPNQFPPWSNHVVNVGALGIPAGTPIWIAIQEYEWDNVHNGAAVQLDVINSDLAAPPEVSVSPTSRTFTAYYDGADPAAQTFALQGIGSSGFAYSHQLLFGAGPTNWLTIAGPAAGTLGFQQGQSYTASVSAAGLDLGTYHATNVFTVPGATNSPLRVSIIFNVIRRPQTIAFPNPGPQYTTNQVGLAGTATSGQQVTFSVFSGPGSIIGATNLSFTGTGTVKVVAWQLGNVYYDVAPCVTNALAVTKPDAGISFADLSHVYDGSPHGATVTTVPEGLTVATTYNGGASLPVAIGSYAVTSIVNDVMYGGMATATYAITRMVQTMAFPDPGAQWTTNHVGLSATASSGLPVAFSVASGPGAISGGTNLTFTGAGAVSVVATQAGDADWLPAAATNSIAVSKAAATVTLGSLSQTYDGSAKPATATTVPAGLTVDFTYEGSGVAPANVGTYAVTGTINDAIYHGTDIGALVIGKGTAPVALGDLAQEYDGTAKTAIATTAPAGLAVDFTYDGETNWPVAVGAYAVTGTVNEANWQGLATGTLVIGKGTATILLGDLSHVYDGTAKSAAATTDPAGLTVAVTYDGGADPPAEVGSYAVTGTVSEANWQGTNVGTLVIAKISATVVLGDLSHVYDGAAKSATATTDPAGLVVDLTYDGSGTAPAAAGSYAVTGMVNEAHYQGIATETLVIAKGSAPVVLGDLSPVYDGVAKSATAATDPAGLTVDFTYDGSETAPAAAGSYAVTGTVNEANWQGAATGTLVIGKGTATVVLGDLSPVYDGVAKSATATTDPAGLTVDFTYDGSGTAPAAAGSYAVTGTVNEANWQGSGTGTLTIGIGTATVTLGGLAQEYDGSGKSATATTVPAGLVVEITYDGSTDPPAAVGAYAVTGTVNDANWQGSSTGTLVIGKGAATVALGDLAHIHDGTAKSATATTVPAGLAVEITYDGSTDPPVAVGAYAVTGMVNEANYQGSATGTLTIGKAVATVALGDLLHTYDGTAKSATATTEPAGLTVDFTYDGSATAPTGAGSHAVTGRVNDADWQGSATGTLTIGKASATVALGDLSPTYDGTAKSATATTEPAGLTVDFTYDGSATAPTEAGSYAVTGGVNEANWQGTATGTLEIAKGTATVVLGDLSPVYDGAAKSATAMTVPAGLAVDFTYDGSGTAPTAAGSYAVTGMVNDLNYEGWTAGTLTIGKGPATVTVEDLAQTYDGSGKSATATTVPAGLAVDFTYDGATVLPIAAGTYAVTGAVNDANWQGTSTGTLAIGKGSAPVTLGNLVQTHDGTPKRAAATTVPAGLAVDFTYDGSPTAPTAVGTYAVTGTVNDANYQGAATGELQIVVAAASLGGVVWLDENRDGAQNAGESGIPNVRIELSTNGTVMAETRTDLDGCYRFAGLPPGDYAVRVDTATLAGDLAGNPTDDPDDPAVPRDHQTAVTLVPGESSGAADFGYVWAAAAAPQGCIGDRIWVDDNRNGRQDPGEPGLPGATLGLFIDEAGNGNYTTRVATATTDAAGRYVFSDLAAGAYVIRVATATLPPSFVQTGDPDVFGGALTFDRRDHQTTVPVVLAPGGVWVNADFGYAFSASSSLGDRIYLDLDADGALDPGEPGIPGVTVVLLDDAEHVCASAVTDDDGAYRFAGLSAGTCTVWVSDSGDRLNRRVQTGGPGGVLGLRGTVVVDGASADLEQDFGFAPEGHVPGDGLIGDTVFLDRDGDGGEPLPGEGMQGVTVDLYDDAGLSRLATAVTDAGGRYYFGGLEAATYVVAVDANTLPNNGGGLIHTVDPDSAPPGDNRATVAVAAGEVKLGQNFGYEAAAPNTIGGILWRDDNANGAIDAGENQRFEGVKVVLQLTNGNVVGSMYTGADGVYRFTGLPDGVYEIEVVDLHNRLFGFWSSPAAGFGRRSLPSVVYHVAVNGGVVRATGHVGYYLAQATLGDFVWRDVNGNGLQEGGEPGLAGVRVSLRIEYPDGTQIDLQALTDANGLYRFSNLLVDPRYAESTASDPATEGLPRFTLSMDTLQPALGADGYWPTASGAGGGTDESRDPAGTVAVLRKGGHPVTYDFGYAGGPLLAVVGNIEAFTRDGQTRVRWETIESWGTVGFWLERRVGDGWARISQELLPFPLFGVAPIIYEEVDPGAQTGGTYVYRLVELESSDNEQTYGPYALTVDGAGHTYDAWAADNFTSAELADPAISGRDADPDGDRLTNAQEFLAWTHPGRADSVLQFAAARPVPEGFELRWQSVAGRFYRIGVASGMAGPFWPLAQEILATDETTSVTLPVDSRDRQLYFQVILVGGTAGE